MPKSKIVEHGPSIGEMTTRSSPPAIRTQTGRFAPGQSGNPSGRPKREEDIAALARTHAADAIAVLVSIAENPKANDSLGYRPLTPSWIAATAERRKLWP